MCHTSSQARVIVRLLGGMWAISVAMLFALRASGSTVEDHERYAVTPASQIVFEEPNDQKEEQEHKEKKHEADEHKPAPKTESHAPAHANHAASDEAAKAEGESGQGKAGEQAQPAQPQAKPAQEAKPAPAPAAQAAAPSRPDRYRAKRELIKIEKTYTATLQPRDPVEICLETKTWTSFQVKEVVDHGQEVRQGDTLVRFDTEDIDRAIADQERTVRSTEQSLKDAERLLALMEKTVPFDLATVERNLKITKEDTDRYFSKERDLLIRNYEMNLKAAEWSLESAREELRQLEKMYKADDLVEETEEFILKRQRQAVERAEFYYQLEKDRYERFHAMDLARRDEDARRDLELASFIAERSRINLPSLLIQQRMSVEQLRTDLERAKDRLAKLRADRTLFEIKSPCDGVVYFGQFTRGEWSGASVLQSKLRPGGSVSKGDVIMTVVHLPPATVRFKVGEEDLRWMEPGRDGTFKPTALPDLAIPAAVTKVDRIPIAPNQFEVLAELDLPKKPLGLA
ncbi:HlyD family secretion protein, partial [Thermogutta sp.]|uniref:HlyD family secretion protein n=1 Tax=Thermogutta sp. TaxID=1962930 RepID=UPI003C7A7086